MSSFLVNELSSLCLSKFSKQAPQPRDTQFNSFSFSHERAFRASKTNSLAAIQTPERSDSVVSFLRNTGLSETQINILISRRPQLLRLNVKLLESWAHELAAHGFTGETLVQLIHSNPGALELKSTLPRLKFWRDFTGNNEKFLLRVIKINPMLIMSDIDKKIIPNINVLREYGLSDKKIMAVVMEVNGFILQCPDYIRQCLERMESLGLSPGSGMFVKGLCVISKLKKGALQKKFDFLKNTYGWSEEEVHMAFRLAPYLFILTEERVKSKMDFLIEKAGLNRESIISLPILLTYSLEKRMVPRHYVLTVLKSKGLEKICKFCSTTIMMTDKEFVERFVVPYKELPELADIYASSCAGTVD